MPQVKESDRERHERILYPQQTDQEGMLDQVGRGLKTHLKILFPIFNENPTDHEQREFETELDASLNHWGINSQIPGIKDPSTGPLVFMFLKEMEKFPHMTDTERGEFFDSLDEFGKLPGQGTIAQTIRLKSQRIERKGDEAIKFPRTMTDTELLDEIKNNYDRIDQTKQLMDLLEFKPKKSKSKASKPKGFKPKSIYGVGKEIAEKMAVVNLNRERKANDRLFEELNRRPSLSFGDEETRILKQSLFP
ncbi:hypothetical protein WH96_02165 [Kiloniella spongiae]|uniref:Uncharacterized protein n=1 Tax=Kiloniella spongiae TaxID=1489064 RepID=A0A0H2MIU8_9PROT|nr:hypothetical protein [Kiloniella spongiae]KLN62338.1 hypothetical protein WH96_02165 [Kiloniella spongiae]